MALLKTSWGVLAKDKELAVIPILSAFFTLVITGLMGVGAWATIRKAPTPSTSLFEGTTTTSTSYQQTPATYVVIILGYILISVAVTFFTASLMAGAHERLTGGSPTLGSAFGKAASRFPQLLGWALINATVGYILRSLAERGGIFGAIIASLLDFAWTILSWLAVPYIVIEGLGPFDALKQSATALKKTWGENLIANAGFGLLSFVIALFAFAIGTVLWVVGLPFVGIGVALAMILVSSVIISALTGIYRTALFMYASNGYIANGFSPEMLHAAFRPKRFKALGV